MKYHKIILLILACVFACVSIFFTIKTFSKYATAADGTANIPIAKWNITVNNMSIKNNTNISSILSPTFPGSEHIAKNVLAPTAEGYFDLAFDFSNVDVSFIYNILISANENSSVKDLVVKGYSIDNEPMVTFNTTNRDISEQINYTDKLRSRNVRIYIMWNDLAETSVMNNVEDTLATVNNGTGLIDVSISFIQIARDLMFII